MFTISIADSSLFTLHISSGFLEDNLANLDLGAARRAAEVEEQADGRCIGFFPQRCTLNGVDIRLVGRDVVATFAEEVRVARVGERDGHAWAVVVGLQHQLEVVGLLCAGRQLGVDVELALPL